MKYSIKQLQNAVFNLITEDKKAFLAKFQDEPNVQQTVDKFWNEIRHRANGQNKDIEYWYKRPYSEFQKFVDTFDLSSKQEKKQRQQYELKQQAEDAGAQMLGILNGYEVWHIPTYEASVILGRNYKNRPTHWCISSDDPEYWFENYDIAEFIFLIREQPIGDEYDKVAIEFQDGGRTFNVDNIVVWDLNDNDDYDASQIPDSMLHEIWLMFIDSGLKKKDVMQW